MRFIEMISTESNIEDDEQVAGAPVANMS